MSETNTRIPIHELAPTTYRPAEALARAHGFESVAALAESLPMNAHVVDLGAGDSPFGNEIAALRTDITWTNFDLSYTKEPQMAEQLQKQAPSNVEYVAGDIMKLTEQYDPESVDTIFSYWLFPHLSLAAPAPAKEAARQVFTIAKPNALISIGPTKLGVNITRTIRRRLAPAEKFHRGQDKEGFADKVYKATKLGTALRMVQKTANEVATPYFGTTRYTKRENGKILVFDPVSGEYIKALSKRGAYHAGKIGVAGVRNIMGFTGK